MLEFQKQALGGGDPEPWTPNVDIHEKDGELIVSAELQDFAMRDVRIAIDHGDLVLDGDGWDETDPGRERYEHLHARLPLPFAVESGRVVAVFDHGILEVRLPFKKVVASPTVS